MLVENVKYNKKNSNYFYQLMKRLLLMFVALLTAISSFADGKYVVIDGLRFFVRTDTKEAILFDNSYSGNITVPEKITDEGVEYTVTSFANSCFSDCKSLTSVSIPSSVTSIGSWCFAYCEKLKSITIPSSVTSLGEVCFFDCKSLTSITIPSSVTLLGHDCFGYCSSLTSITIPSSVTSLGDKCFEGCTSLTSISIPSSVTSLGDKCFISCSGLTSISIPSSVTSLGNACFGGCSGLTSISIPSSVTSLSQHCFSGCSGLTSISIPSSVTSLGVDCFNGCTSLESVTIPNSVTKLGERCFYVCTSLKSITIPNSVTSLGDNCFIGCSGLTKITCKNPTPPRLGSDVFSNNTYLVSTLYVPDVEAYMNTYSDWKNFKDITKIISGDEDKPVEPCAKPTIGYADGQLKFTDATEGAKFHYTLTCSDVQNDKFDEEGSVDLAACYDIAVYATADGYKPSDKATAKLYWVKADGSLTTDNINAAKKRGVVVAAEGGIVTVSGLSDGEKVEFYAIDGKLIGEQKANSGTVSIATSEHVVICKMGGASIKILVK